MRGIDHVIFRAAGLKGVGKVFRFHGAAPFLLKQAVVVRIQFFMEELAGDKDLTKVFRVLISRIKRSKTVQVQRDHSRQKQENRNIDYAHR